MARVYFVSLLVVCLSSEIFLISIGYAQLPLDARSAVPLEDSIVTLIKTFEKSKVISDFDLIANASVGYLPLVDSTSLISGFSKSYWIQSSASIFGLPFSASYGSSSNILFSPQSFSYRQFSLSFNCQQFFDNLKKQVTDELQSRLSKELKEFENYHYSDSLALYENIKDTLASAAYQDLVVEFQNKKEKILDSLEKGLPCDTSSISKINHELDQYHKYQQMFSSLMRYQEKITEVINQLKQDSLTSQLHIDGIAGIASKDELIEKAGQLGIRFGKNLWPLNFREMNLGTQLLNHSPLTFYNYYSRGLNVTYNDGRYIVKTALVKNNLGLINPLTIQDSLRSFPSTGQTIALLGVGKGDLNKDYTMVSLSYVRDRKAGEDIESNQIIPDKWLMSLNERIILSRSVDLKYEIGTTFTSGTPLFTKNKSLDDLYRQSSAYASLDYSLEQTKSYITFETFYVGDYYFTGGNYLLLPGTFNVAAGIKQQLFKSKLLIDYKLNLSEFTGINNRGSNNFYQFAQVSYRLGRIGTVSLSLTPYLFNYTIPSLTQESSSRANFISINTSLNIPFGKKILFSNLNFSNYAYQSTFSDTMYSTSTDHISCYLFTTVGKQKVNLIGNYYYSPSPAASPFINSFELTSTVIQSKILELSVGPKWLGFENYSDQVGAKMNAGLRLGKHLFFDATIEKYFNTNRQKEPYPSSVMAVANLGFKL